LWFVETAAKHPQSPDNAERVNYKIPGFLAKFWELQQVMWATNAGLTDRHAYDSRPLSWPRLRRGINFWVKDHHQIYLIGNPFIWWLSTASVVAYLLVRGFLILRAKRGYRDFENTRVVKYDSLCGFLFIGYSLHYFPFFLMSRQLFLHHYFPALYFAILLSCAVFDFATSALKPKVRLQIAAVLAIVAIWNFSEFSPLTYGNPWTKRQCTSAQWVKTWDFACNEFLDDSPAPTQNKTASVATVGGEPGGRAAIVVDDAEQFVAPEDNTAVPFGIVAEPGKDVFAKDDRDRESKSVARGGSEQKDAASSGGDVERVVSVVSVEGPGGTPAVEGGAETLAGDVGEPLEAGEEASTVAVPAVADETAVPEGRRPEGPLDHEEAIAIEVAHELYPEARDVSGGQRLARDE